MSTQQYDFAFPGRIFSEQDIKALLVQCEGTRYPVRNRAIVLLSTDAGLSPSEISDLKRYAVLNEYNQISDEISLLGKSGKNLRPRRIPMAKNSRLQRSIRELLETVPALPGDPLVISQRAVKDVRGAKPTKNPGVFNLTPIAPTSVSYIFYKLASKAGVRKQAARTCRRTFLMKMVKNAAENGYALRDVQAITGQRSLDMLQRFTEENLVVQQKMIDDLFS